MTYTGFIQLLKDGKKMGLKILIREFSADPIRIIAGFQFRFFTFKDRKGVLLQIEDTPEYLFFVNIDDDIVVRAINDIDKKYIKLTTDLTNNSLFTKLKEYFPGKVEDISAMIDSEK